MAERRQEDLWIEVQTMLDKTPADDEKKEFLREQLRERPETWPHFIKACERELAEQEATRG